MDNTKNCQAEFFLKSRYAITGPWGPDNESMHVVVPCEEALKVFRECIFNNENRANGSRADLLTKPTIIISDFRFTASSTATRTFRTAYLEEPDFKKCKAAVESALSIISKKK